MKGELRLINFLRLFISVVLIIIGLVIYPTIRASDRTIDIAESVAEAATRDFVDSVRSKGYVDNVDYQIFIDTLSSTGVVFDVELEHYKKIYEPLYGDPLNFYTFTNQFEVIYDGYFTKDILDKLFPSSPLPPNSPDRRYEMRTGDLFNVRIVSVGKLPGSNLKVLYGGEVDKVIAYNYGGMVRDEAP